MLIESILNEIYPNICGLCESVCKQNICTKCTLKLQEKIQFRHIKHYNKYFQEHGFLFSYDGELRNKLLSYKFFEQAYLYRFFAEMILKNQQAVNLIKKYDIIIPVPLHPKRMNERGYNQAELIAKQIAKSINKIEIKSNILFKIKPNLPQSLQNKENRKANVKGVYIARKTETIYNKKILLFDDIYTTGNTVNECSKVLKRAGIEHVRSIYTIKRLKRWELNGRFSRKHT